jgi:hypothetical protein
MIALASNYLVFRLASGESLPLCAEGLAADLVEHNSRRLDPELVSQAASAVFYYFKHEMGLQTVTIGEFAQALEKALRIFKAQTPDSAEADTGSRIGESDLSRIAGDSADAGELFFFPRLRDELRSQIESSPRFLRFRGLRRCAKQLAGARRWSPRCQSVQDRIVDYLRGCLTVEAGKRDVSLVID